MWAASGGRRAGGDGASGNGGRVVEEEELGRDRDGESTEERCADRAPALVVELTKGGGPDARWVVMGGTVAFWTPVT